MASSSSPHGSSSSSSHSGVARLEQIIAEFLRKSLHIILESRSPSPFASSSLSRNYSGGDPAALVITSSSSPSSSASASPPPPLSSSSSVRSRDKWFKLALGDCPPAALENMDFWRHHSNLELMVVDVILVWRNQQSHKYWNSSQQQPEEFGSEKIIERWVVQLESSSISRDGLCTSSGSGSRRSSTSLQTMYKKSILLLRSLYLTVRLLPAYKLFRKLNSRGGPFEYAFTLAPRVFPFVEPFTRRDESEMQRFGFVPVDTPNGRLCLSVTYSPSLSLSDISSPEPSTPMTPRFIPNYVGSPIADPIKRLPSLPSGYAPLWRPNSCGHDFYNAMRPPMSLPRYPSETSLAHSKDMGFDDYWTSLNKLSSPSPSSPISIPGCHPAKLILRSESAPVRIPAVKAVNSPALKNKLLLAPSPSPRLGPMQTGAAVDKVIDLGRDESGKFSGVKTSCSSSPQLSVSRSLSRLYIQDDLDESGFECPFIEDDDIADAGNREEFYDRLYVPVHIEPGSFPVKKSQQAAVGDLVHKLQKAPPLRLASNPQTRNSDNISEPHQISSNPVSGLAPSSLMSSGVVTYKTTANALEELRIYREMKEVLLSRGSRPLPR